ncbi:MAG: DUF86 domain-containing protein [Deltaproteobacteria bacterium]|nr:DUF86 domain-containing protein [Deltaproteobacteria bacterium]
MNDDLVRVRHILDAAREALAFVDGRERADLDRDRKLALALVRLIEVIGEAASRVGPDFRARHPEVPWAAIVAMRNRLIHAYYEVDPDRVWDTATVDLPPLVASLEPLV